MGTLLFITKYLDGDFNAIQKEVYILAVPYAVVFIAMVLDLIAGILKAKKLGEARTSIGLRRTVSKFKDYYGMLLVATLIDILLSVIEPYNVPYATFASGIYLTFIEGLSIREKGEDKIRRQGNKDLKALVAVLENRGDLVKAFAEIVKNEIAESNTNITDNTGSVNTGTVGGHNISINEKGAT